VGWGEMTKKIIPIWDVKYVQDCGQYEAIAILLRAWARNNRGKDTVRSTYPKIQKEVLGIDGARTDYLTRLVSGESTYCTGSNLDKIDAITRHFLSLNPQNYPKWNNKILNHNEPCWEIWYKSLEFAERIFSLKRAYNDYDTKGKIFDKSLNRYGRLQPTDISIASVCDKQFDHTEETFMKNAKAFGCSDDVNYVSYACFRLGAFVPGNFVRTRLIIDQPKNGFRYCRFTNLAHSEEIEDRDTEGLVLNLDGSFHFVGRMKVPGGIDAKTMVFAPLQRNRAKGLVLTRAITREGALASRMVIVREKPLSNDFRKLKKNKDYLGAFDPEELNTHIDSLDFSGSSNAMCEFILKGIQNVRFESRFDATLRKKLKGDYHKLEAVLQKAILLNRI